MLLAAMKIREEVEEKGLLAELMAGAGATEKEREPEEAREDLEAATTTVHTPLTQVASAPFPTVAAPPPPIWWPVRGQPDRCCA